MAATSSTSKAPNLPEMSLLDLQAACRRRSLFVKGTKDMLIARLEAPQIRCENASWCDMGKDQVSDEGCRCLMAEE
jgi:hypothetical protein